MENKINPNSYSPLTLAFLGDAVFELKVRNSIVLEANQPVKQLHSASSARVCAHTQAQAIKKILPLLSKEEQDVYKRGRNAHVGTVPKNQSVADYHCATGLEALFGWLFLSGEKNRIDELFEIIEGEANKNE